MSNIFENGWDGKVITDDMVFVYLIPIFNMLGKESVFVGRVKEIGTKFR